MVGNTSEISIAVKNVNVVLNSKAKPTVLRWQMAIRASSRGAKQRSIKAGKRHWYRVVGGIWNESAEDLRATGSLGLVSVTVRADEDDKNCGEDDG